MKNTKIVKAEVFNVVRTKATMASIMDQLTAEKYADEKQYGRVADYMNLIARRRKQSLKYTPSVIKQHVDYRKEHPARKPKVSVKVDKKVAEKAA